jgi:hypoxanthine phosphoribosyltransferase
MISKDFNEIKEKILNLDFNNESFDMIVAIANGALIPAALLQQKLQIPLEIIRINYRDNKQNPIYNRPKLLREIDFNCENKRILLVEDRVKTGITLNYAASLLYNATWVKTIAVNGPADYSLYNESCFKFPWNF